MLARLCELGGLMGFGTIMLFGAGSSEIIQAGGMFALIVFMVAQNYRQGVRMATAIDRKDEALAEAHARHARLEVGFTDAINDMSKALADRPCVQADSRVQKPRVQT